MKNYTYYVTDYATGTPREIFRGEAEGLDLFGSGVLWRARKDGAWSDLEDDVRPLLNLWLKGDFDPEEDEISEEQAMAYLEKWRSSGNWPGRE